MKRLSALLLLLSLLTLTAWTLEDCVEVDFDHPHCDQYVTTTTGVPTSTTSLTQPESTTSTSGAENSTTTSIPTEQPTTTVTSSTPIPTTTTTVQQCPPGTIHQPPLCLSSTTTVLTDTSDTTAVISPPEELPHTGIADLGLLALAGVSLAFLGFTALKYGRKAE